MSSKTPETTTDPATGKKYPAVKGMRVFMGNYVPENYTDIQSALRLFGQEEDGCKKFEYWKAFVTLNWPEPIFIWDEWADLFFAALCGYKELIEKIIGSPIDSEGKWWQKCMSTGCASSGKSSKAAMWILGCWLVAQKHTSCILTSTSLQMLQKRIWAELCEWIKKSKWRLGGGEKRLATDVLEIVPSDLIIRYTKDDSRSAIFGIAVKTGGDPQEAVDRIKGIHNRAVYVVIDEMTAVPAAITSACSNLNKGTKRFGLLGIGNALPSENQHTVYCEPAGGWNTTTVDCQFWLTKKGGCCVHFDGHLSPALRDPDRFHFYVNREQLDSDRIEFGGENTPEYWTTDRGYWPPTGLSNSVMDLALFAQFKVEDKAVWKRGFTVGAAFDPAFEGGDRRVLYPFKWGEFASGITGIEYQKPIIVGIDVQTDVRWIHYAISDAVQKVCENYEIDEVKMPILPANFISDTSGEGGGLFSVMSGRWSAEIQSVEFGVGADKTVISPDRPVTYYELYGNKVTMLYYVLRRFIEGGQVKGLTDQETRSELIGREKKQRTGKTVLIPKSEMKTIRHKSPDKADACVIGAEFLRRQGVVPSGKTGGAELLSLEKWNEHAEEIALEEESYDDGEAAYA